jgi:pimeloyl-ACP methyl ester carboxylesterase
MDRMIRRLVGPILGLLLNVVTASAAPCLTPTASCTEYVAIRSGPARVLVYRSHSLTTPAPDITHAIIAIHGAERDAATSFRIAMAATVLRGRPDQTLVIAPRFAARAERGCNDDLAAGEVNWPCDVQLRDWRMGGSAVSDGTLASFDVLDQLLTTIENRFPNLQRVVIVGHSAGGQFVTNYQMTNPVHEGLRVPPTYVAANASAYAYPDQARPTDINLATCPMYADWPFGMSARVGYVSRSTSEQIREHAAQRPITVLVGELDTQVAGGGFFGSCAALAQGATRRERGETFGKHMATRYNARQNTAVVPGCGHSESCMFLSRPGMTALFPSER